MSTKDKILETSIKLFSELGYEGTSMMQVAEAVGIKKPSLYAHFDSKEKIFISTVEKVAVEYVNFISETINDLKDNSTEDKLLNLLQTTYRVYNSDDHLGEFFYRFVLFSPSNLKNQVREIIKDSDRKLHILLQKIIEDGKQHNELDPELSSESVLRSYLCIFNNIDVDARYYSLKGKELDKHLLMIWEVFWRGVKY
ncbi:TetR/AcrR family transcriptional regulator [Tenuibacillus multivorans]|uniref:DNA-binding transcriptional regulator, AcrR family n=1 Tax=Tenuibacillus multivorans TaxID=237069 RepID=A0A1H0DZT5_9BACI|nr:TetR/AcrR family transcriptional regulator [Tenuibacillus multivorans]GEL76716.1 TetR family transcriptional regulator [Tenuibacillus multivorans]SDN75533.1 DNA-binding transcriptional regulator, AcrR family [Tenuibacillus multivorans]